MLVPTKFYHPFSCEGAVLKGTQKPGSRKEAHRLPAGPEAQKIFKEWSFRRTMGPLGDMRDPRGIFLTGAGAGTGYIRRGSEV